MPKGLNLAFQDPGVMLRQALAEMKSVGSVDLFNSSDQRMQKIQERWCTAKFGLGYKTHIQQCEVAVNDTTSQLFADFFVRTKTGDYGFQIVEAGIPDRRRGKEYKLASEMTEGEEFSPDWEVASGADWVGKAIAKKCSKKYGAGVRLLVYANFWTDSTLVEYEKFCEASAPYHSDFESMWIVSNDWLMSVKDDPALGAIYGFGTFTS